MDYSYFVSSYLLPLGLRSEIRTGSPNCLSGKIHACLLPRPCAPSSYFPSFSGVTSSLLVFGAHVTSLDSWPRRSIWAMSGPVAMATSQANVFPCPPIHLDPYKLEERREGYKWRGKHMSTLVRQE